MGQRNQLIWDLPAVETFYLNKEIYNVSEARFKKAVGDLTEILRAKDLLTKPVKTLSLGERMKMELIAGLIHNPKIIFFDEPTIGLDIFSQEVIRDFIKFLSLLISFTNLLSLHSFQSIILSFLLRYNH